MPTCAEDEPRGVELVSSNARVHILSVLFRAAMEWNGGYDELPCPPYAKRGATRKSERWGEYGKDVTAGIALRTGDEVETGNEVLRVPVSKS